MIMVGAPVQNRAHTIKPYLKAVCDFVFDPQQVHLAFLVNNSTDDSLCILKNFKEKYGDDFGRVDIVEYPDFDYTDNPFATNRDYAKIAEVKNAWLSLRTNEDEHILLLDSDTIAPPNTVLDLLCADIDCVAGLVPTLRIKNVEFYNLMVQTSKGTYLHLRDLYEYEPLTYGQYIPRERYVYADVAGGCLMFTKHLLDQPNVEYGYHKLGEDIYMCERIREFDNTEIYCDLNVRCKHLMGKRIEPIRPVYIQ